jgi:Tfp pilus assembly protein PilV
MGITLVEVMVAIGLIAVSLMLVLSLIPAGIHSAQRAEDVQGAVAWSRQLMESAPVPEEFPIPADLARKTFQITLGKTNFEAVRTLSTIPGKSYLYRIDVETTWNDGVRPIRLSLTKFNPAGPEP